MTSDPTTCTCERLLRTARGNGAFLELPHLGRRHRLEPPIVLDDWPILIPTCGRRQMRCTRGRVSPSEVAGIWIQPEGDISVSESGAGVLSSEDGVERGEIGITERVEPGATSPVRTCGRHGAWRVTASQ
jgi:hypothetical protein